LEVLPCVTEIERRKSLSTDDYDGNAVSSWEEKFQQKMDCEADHRGEKIGKERGTEWRRTPVALTVTILFFKLSCAGILVLLEEDSERGTYSHMVPADVFSPNSEWSGFYEYLGKRQTTTFAVTGFNATSGRVNITLLETSGTLLRLFACTIRISVSIFLGTYKSEENQLLLKVYQVKGPTEHYYSKFKNDNWAMDGYVSKRHTHDFNQI
ncbi:hypothetical protein XENOCAPTIV_022547, partial [Xenoophorus captivus]